jgi:hypothetical protein
VKTRSGKYTGDVIIRLSKHFTSQPRFLERLQLQLGPTAPLGVSTRLVLGELILGGTSHEDSLKDMQQIPHKTPYQTLYLTAVLIDFTILHGLPPILKTVPPPKVPTDLRYST